MFEILGHLPYIKTISGDITLEYGVITTSSSSISPVWASGWGFSRSMVTGILKSHRQYLKHDNSICDKNMRQGAFDAYATNEGSDKPLHSDQDLPCQLWEI